MGAKLSRSTGSGCRPCTWCWRLMWCECSSPGTRPSHQQTTDGTALPFAGSNSPHGYDGLQLRSNW